MSGKKLNENTDERYMREAIKQAKKAAAIDEVPIGCVIVHDGEVIASASASVGKTVAGSEAAPSRKIIARGYNRRVTDHSTLAHAEINAIRKACRVIGDWRLEDCTLYVTLEPCPMCAGAIVQARIPRVVIGCMNPKAGCAGSVLDMLHEDGFNHRVDTTIGVLEEECSEMMKEFFRNLRARSEK